MANRVKQRRAEERKTAAERAAAETRLAEGLGWKPSQGADSLPRRGDVHENDEGQDEKIDVPDWDHRVDLVTNKPRIERVTRMMVGRIEVSNPSMIEQ